MVCIPFCGGDADHGMWMDSNRGRDHRLPRPDDAYGSGHADPRFHAEPDG